MRRIILSLFILVAILAALTGCSDDDAAPDYFVDKTSTSSVSVEKVPLKNPIQTSIAPEAEGPDNTTPVTPTTTPPTEGQIFSVKVAGWGQVATNQAKTFTLKAKGQEPGGLSDTTVEVYELCATQDVALPALDYDQFLDVIQIPGDGIINLNNGTGDSQFVFGDDAVITMDDSVAMVEPMPEYPGAETTRLTRVFKKGQCTEVRLELYRRDAGKVIIGFAYTTIPHGEWRVDGDFTVTAEEQPARDFKWEYWIN